MPQGAVALSANVAAMAGVPCSHPNGSAGTIAPIEKSANDVAEGRAAWSSPPGSATDLAGELALHGYTKVALATLPRLITRRTEPHVKLH